MAEHNYRVGIVGATGMVGQRFALLLENHPWFHVTALAASPRSAGKTYRDAVGARWHFKNNPMPKKLADIIVLDASDVKAVAAKADMIFCAVDMPREEIKALETAYAKADVPVFSNNSAHRFTPDVPMIIPEINAGHLDIIPAQRKRLGVTRGFIAVKSNCSIQSYVPMLSPLLEYGLEDVLVCTYQAISGAGKTFETWSEMTDNVIPFIGGEEDKSEKEPLKVWGGIAGDEIVPATAPRITTQCVRVPVTDGHLGAVFVRFKNKPSSAQEIIEQWRSFSGEPQRLGLPSAPAQFITYFEEENFPQTKLHRDLYGGMGVSAGRLREDTQYDYKFIGLSHNTLRGAAGGAVLMAELAASRGLLDN